jgi:hypothetical protein
MSAGLSWAGPIVIGDSVQPLAFGSLVAASGGAVVVSVNPPARGATGNVFPLRSGTWSAASFSVSGDPNASYSITLPANGVVFLTSGPNSMAVNSFNSHPATGQLASGGTQTLSIGATLSVGANQANGSYSGNFTVTVEYN